MRRLGIVAGSAAEQLQRSQPSAQAVEELPTPTGMAPFRASSEELEIPAGSLTRTFHVMGDTGGIKDPVPQLAVAKAMVADLTAYPEVGFAYHLGDVDYFEGEAKEYGPQFYEAYATYLRHVLAIPGNHDGEGGDRLAAFMANFCDSEARVLPQFEEFNRDTMTQPNCYWTLLDPAVTIIGLYTNVPSGGVVQAEQAEWFENELAQAPEDVPVIVALHHPPFSCDAHHGGCPDMGKLIDTAVQQSGRVPDAVLSGHVHDYQRFTRTISGKEVPYIVCGAGGYHNLHEMASDATKGQEVASGVVLEQFNATVWGFLRLQVGIGALSGEYVGVARDGTVTGALDVFSYKVV